VAVRKDKPWAFSGMAIKRTCRQGRKNEMVWTVISAKRNLALKPEPSEAYEARIHLD
jgi:hypothetical protein